ncbi:SDR family NAD(P)-dependent oxidoreductase [Caballeronia sp. J97]|uniref:SDR family NAD(P)-dependent oxidoreductase n=1 Tax=Caballeronia sp. J97 TaxID=2805429 RepID=UPI002AAF7702|nr:SDR family NAD(P)-dependent oxidoreductase [Caballeronia sp. J97]
MRRVGGYRLSRTENDAADVLAVSERLGAQAIAVRADVAIGDDVNAMIEDIAQRLGRNDILVNDAGTAKRIGSDDRTDAEFSERGPCCRACARRHQRQRRRARSDRRREMAGSIELSSVEKKLTAGGADEVAKIVMSCINHAFIT